MMKYPPTKGFRKRKEDRAREGRASERLNTRVQGALVQGCQLGFGLSRKDAVGRAEHDGHVANSDVVGGDELVAVGAIVLEADFDRRTKGRIRTWY